MEDMPQDLKDYTDAELQKIAANRHNYDESFARAAQLELEKRESDRIKPEVAEREDVPVEETASATIPESEMPLPVSYIVLTFFMPSVIVIIAKFCCNYLLEESEYVYWSLPIVIFTQAAWIIKLRNNGYYAMAIEMKMWVLNSWIVYISVFALERVLSIIAKLFLPNYYG